MRYSARALMRRGARPCGQRSPGPGRARSGGRSPHYKSQKPAGPPRPPAPSPERRAGDGNGRGDAPVSGRRGRPTRCARRGKRLAGLGAADPRQGAARRWRLASVPRADMAGENPGFPPPPASRLRGSQGTTKEPEKCGWKRAWEPRGDTRAAGGRAGNHNCSRPPFFFCVCVFFKSRFALGNALSHLLRNN